MLKIKSIGSNKSELITANMRILISYETPVAAEINGEFYRTSKFYSATTNRHISLWLNSNVAIDVEQLFFDNLMNVDSNSSDLYALEFIQQKQKSYVDFIKSFERLKSDKNEFEPPENAPTDFWQFALYYARVIHYEGKRSMGVMSNFSHLRYHAQLELESVLAENKTPHKWLYWLIETQGYLIPE